MIEAATFAGIRAHSVDIYVEHHPMTQYAASVVGAGSLPLWNPYQLCGMPFVAIPHTGLLYPPNLVYLLFETAVATEVSLVIHLLVAALGMALLIRTLGLGAMSALAAAMTFTFSGWILYQINVPAAIACQSWLPLTVFFVERAVRGGPWAAFGLAIVVGLQTLSGAPEYVLYNMYAAGLFTLFRLGACVPSAGWPSTLRTAALLLAAVATGALLASVQLFPSFELAAQSVREPLTLQKALGAGKYSHNWIPAREFGREILVLTGTTTVGVLPLLGLWLSARSKDRRSLWMFAVVASLLSASLVFGGAAFELYHQTLPGQMFRRPVKFLQIYTFAQALLAALAIARLEERFASSNQGETQQPRRRRQFLAAAPVVAVALGVAFTGLSAWWLAACAALALAFTLPARFRTASLAGLLVVHGLSVFLAGHNGELRPAAQPAVFDKQAHVLDRVARLAGSQRIYLDGKFLPDPSLTMKQGTLRSMRAVGDYEPLATKRYAEFFRVAARESQPRNPFVGVLGLNSRSRWRLMDLTSTRYYVVPRRSEVDTFMGRHPGDFRAVEPSEGPGPRVYERAKALPRAMVVGSARSFTDPRQVLRALVAMDFDPRAEVLLEVEAGPAPATTEGMLRAASAQLVIDEPERVVVKARSDRAGYLVLSDAYYPGWRARVDGKPVSIHRANYLFRAVPIPAGESRVEFVFESDSLERGLWTSAGAVALLATLTPVLYRRRMR
ncbi:MAG: YfhO family protein [bacterium]|nr:YfhO family protein [bacterium]